MAVRISVDGRAWIVDSVTEAPEDCQRAMVACYTMGGRPEISQVDTSKDINGIKVESYEALQAPSNVIPFVPVDHPSRVSRVLIPIGHDLPFPDAAQSARADGPFAAVTNTTRIGGMLSDLRASDPGLAQSLTGRKASGPSYGEHRASHNGQAHYGERTHARRATMHERQIDIRDAAHALVSRIEAENRSDVTMSALELARSLEVNGKITIAGKALTEQAIRGLAARLESPMLSYILGVRDRQTEAVHNARACEQSNRPDDASTLRAKAQADRAIMAAILSHECRQNPDAVLKLRTRNGDINDVFAVVSSSYAPADAPAIVGRLVDAFPNGAKGESTYDPHSTAWELRASIWTPTPIAQHAVGEPFAGFASLRGRDNGTGKARGSGGVEILSCLNSAVYTAESAAVSRVHRGKILSDVHAMIDGATKSIDVLCKAWGVARVTEIPMTAEEKQIGSKFMSDLFMSLLKNDRQLCGVLPGRTADHATGLLRAYHEERRDPDRLVRSDVAQSWTRYIQDQAPAVRQDAEEKIGRWLVAV